jgi:2-dehydro-3-deoxyphosphogluconate aldolase / (4S)-4-hydroxy-2-oxoglutarate aldolase
MMNTILKQISLLGIVPVVVIDDENAAVPLANALIDAGLPCAEITFRTAAAVNVLRRIQKEFPDMLLGAGTVLSSDQVKMAIDVGAKFIVSPGLNQGVVEYCLANDITVTPGIATPTEIGQVSEYGLTVVKYFPAEANGGLAHLKAISAPYPQMQFIPTGGIDETNILSYLNYPKVLACGGSWMVTRDLISNGSFDEIKKRTSQAVSKILGFSLRHIGINTSDAGASQTLASEIARIFKMNQRVTDGSVFVGEQFEVLKRIYLGKNGHIAISTNFIERAIDYFERNGIRTIDDTRNVVNGKLHTIYLDIDLGGFAVHLIQV